MPPASVRLHLHSHCVLWWWSLSLWCLSVLCFVTLFLFKVHFYSRFILHRIAVLDHCSVVNSVCYPTVSHSWSKAVFRKKSSVGYTAVKTTKSSSLQKSRQVLRLPLLHQCKACGLLVANLCIDPLMFQTEAENQYSFCLGEWEKNC